MEEIYLEQKNTKILKPLHLINVNDKENIINKIELDEINILKRGELLYKNGRYSKYKINADINGSIICVTSANNEEMIECNNSNKKIMDESYENYKKEYEEYSKLSDKKWIDNILNKKQNKDIVVYEDQHFIMVPDIKWTDDILDNLYYLVLVKRQDLCSLRNLTNKEIPLLEHILEKGLNIIEKKHGIDRNKIRTYIHYRPSVWQLHIHFNHLNCKNATCSIDYSHQLTSVIQNLKLDGSYYQKINLRILI